jgi:Domain of unknown function (DUF1707)
VETFWESFRLDPRQAGHASMRASDADREIVRTVLADSFADGRLTREEYDDRLNTLYGSRTLGEVSSLVSDLVPLDGPATTPAPLLRTDFRTRGARKWRRDVEESLAAFLVPSIICTVIWVAITGRGFFWPVFPMLFLGINLIKTVVQRESVIEREVLRLEKQAAKDAARELPAERGDPDAARLRRSGVTAERVIGGNLDQDDPDAIGILDPHFGQAPGLGGRLPDDRDSGRGQPGVLGADIPYLDPDHHRTPGRAVRVPGDLEQPLAEEEHHPGIVGGTELPVNGQTQHVAVEAAAAAQIGGPHEDPAAQNVHATISAPCSSAGHRA